MVGAAESDFPLRLSPRYLEDALQGWCVPDWAIGMAVLGVECRVTAGGGFEDCCEKYIRESPKEVLEKGRLGDCAAGFVETMMMMD